MFMPTLGHEWGSETANRFSHTLNSILYKSEEKEIYQVFETLIDKNAEKLNSIPDVNKVAIFLFQQYKDKRINEVLQKLEIEPNDELKIELKTIGDYEIDSLHALFTRECLIAAMKSHTQQLGNRICPDYKITLEVLTELKK